MSFFGITALGPPNMFELYKHSEISAVSKDDFFAAFRMVAGGSGTITHKEVVEVLFEAMGGVKADEAAEADFVAGFDAVEGDIDIELFEDVLDSYNLKFATRPAKQYVSSAKLRHDRMRHIRCDGGSHDKYHAPLTCGQEYGWGDPRQNIGDAELPCGKMFNHRPSFMSYYAESMVCYEEGRDLCAGPTMKSMEQ
uniref:EF-hand domain-containing protein n=1 Tax=Hemiselmis andersenii TaxID=464988 RepID=A0A6T8MRD2_HEMAN|mmetsp:Transcript_3331/g.7668  ORF Transcript_3331/g.7668 Transcript_3331/m.7668 type:complete len:195 (+) Transcript_3331:91-675(+)